MQLFAAIAEQHARSQAAFFALMNPPPDTATRRELHRAYREATTSLLELQRRHNESGTAPSPWDLEIVAQPLVQQTMIEADLVDALGHPQEADELREGAYAVAEAYLGPAALARLWRERAILLALEGRFNESLTTLADVGRQFTSGGDVVQAAQTALEEAAVLEWLGDHERALSSIKHARGLVDSLLAARTPGPEDITSSLIAEAGSILAGEGATGGADQAAALWRVSTELVEHEARVQRAVGKFDEAEQLFRSVLGAYASLGASGAAAIEYQLAALDVERGRYEAGWSSLTRMQPQFDDGILRPGRKGLRCLQADACMGLDDPAQALSLVDDGISDLASFPDDDLAWKLHWRRGRALASLSRPDDAIAAYGEAASIVDSLRKAPLGYRLDSTSLRSKLPLFDAAIGLSAERGDAMACARFIELVKARALSCALSIPAEARGPRSELELEFDKVTQRLDALEYQGYSGTAPTADLRRERAGLLARRLELIEQIRLRDPRWRGLSVPVPFEPKLTIDRLAEREQVALTLFVRDARVVSVLVSGDVIEVGTRELESTTLQILGQYAANLLVWRPDPYLMDPGDLGISAETFVPPALLEGAAKAASLVVAPHGVLHLLPWPALTFEGRRLFEHTAVGMTPNLTCTTALDAEFASSPRAALVGTSRYEGMLELEDLPATGLELEELATMYRDRLVAPPAIGPAATERTLRDVAARADADGAILHVSCHGTLSVEDPLGSGLLMVDGKVDAAELASTSLRYDEVVLSACSTGWRPQSAEGIELSGDDILGLPGALLEAGARSIVVSIPKAVDEATRAFMTSYHGFRSLGASPLAAFRRTQLDLLASEHEPYQWIGLVCYAVR
jgi:tetratricopeptide (TPR) repeat protein